MGFHQIDRIFSDAYTTISVCLGLEQIVFKFCFHSVGNCPCCEARSNRYFTGLAICDAADFKHLLLIRWDPGDLLPGSEGFSKLSNDISGNTKLLLFHTPVIQLRHYFSYLTWDLLPLIENHVRFSLGLWQRVLSATGICSSQSRPHRTRRQCPGERDLSGHSACCRGLIWVLLRWGQLAGSEYEHRSAGGQPPGGATQRWCHHPGTWTAV